ncbi:MAG: phosphoadenosine phosphosulfate reductase family protein [Candidatus Scalindua sp.]|jgi:hypothetical protein|nr:phosphoadenosine phosphosulfate reductase family protein [Candidatus Scalindua sp.]
MNVNKEVQMVTKIDNGKEDLIVSFSGGRTSAFMCKWLLDNMQEKYNLYFIYANSSQEHPKTLEFVDACDKAFGLNLVWVEAVVTPEKGVATSFVVVDYDTASLSGNVFEEMVKKYTLPHLGAPHCTRELKTQPMHKWASANGLKHAQWALGIRVDEQRRIKKDPKFIYPLASMKPMRKMDILNYWKTMPFNLEIPEELGNCTWCWKKTLSKHMTNLENTPEIYDFPEYLEKTYPLSFRKKRSVMFREKRSTLDLKNIFKSSAKRFKDANWDGYEEDLCAEECGSVIDLDELIKEEEE